MCVDFSKNAFERAKTVPQFYQRLENLIERELTNPLNCHDSMTLVLRHEKCTPTFQWKYFSPIVILNPHETEKKKPNTVVNQNFLPSQSRVNKKLRCL